MLVAPGKGGARIVALNRAAQLGGLRTGDLLSNARSKVLQLHVRDADPAADAAALRKLALWALRYSPIATAWDETSGGDGLFIDITGCAHLFGGEEGLLNDLAARLARFGLFCRLAVADTPGAAWALARYGRDNPSVLPSGAEADAAVFPAGRCPAAVGKLAFASAAAWIAAYWRCDRAAASAVRSTLRARLSAPPRSGAGPRARTAGAGIAAASLLARVEFLDPIFSTDHVLIAAERLLGDVSLQLARDDAGARALRLLLFRVDAGVVSVDLELAAASHNPEHISRLFGLRLERLGADMRADFGFEAAALHVHRAEPLPPRQAALVVDHDAPSPDGLVQLIDRLRQRLGPGAVRQFHPRQSHIPEHAEELREASPAAVPVEPPMPRWPTNRSLRAGPSFCLPSPEARRRAGAHPRWTTAAIPLARHHAPDCRRRRSRAHPPRMVAAHRRGERDYYVVEDIGGRRFWLYRHGLYGGEAQPRWFVHGVFA